MYTYVRVVLVKLTVCFSLSPAQSGPGGEGVEVALDPSELDLDTATMSAR